MAAAPKSAKPAVPRHIAIVMDGNGRWANKRFMPRIVGHKYGVDSLIRAINACADRGVEYLTVFAFSSENWKRPDEEVSGLMNLVLTAVATYLTRLSDLGVRIRIIGDRAAVSEKVRAAWEHAERSTEANTRITIYSARPGVVIGKKGEDIEKLKKELAAKLGVPVAVNIEEVRKPEVDAQLIADSITQQLEKRIMFRRAMKRAMQNAMRLGARASRSCRPAV